MLTRLASFRWNPTLSTQRRFEIRLVSSESGVTEGSSYRVARGSQAWNWQWGEIPSEPGLPCWQTIFEYWLRSVRAILMPAWISDSQGYLYAACCPLEILFQRRERRGQEESRGFLVFVPLKTRLIPFLELFVSRVIELISH